MFFRITGNNPDKVDDIWKYFKEHVLSATEKVCGWSKKGQWHDAGTVDMVEG